MFLLQIINIYIVLFFSVKVLIRKKMKPWGKVALIIFIILELFLMLYRAFNYIPYKLLYPYL